MTDLPHNIPEMPIPPSSGESLKQISLWLNEKVDALQSGTLSVNEARRMMNDVQEFSAYLAPQLRHALWVKACVDNSLQRADQIFFEFQSYIRKREADEQQDGTNTPEQA